MSEYERGQTSMIGAGSSLGACLTDLTVGVDTRPVGCEHQAVSYSGKQIDSCPRGYRDGHEHVSVLRRV